MLEWNSVIETLGSIVRLYRKRHFARGNRYIKGQDTEYDLSRYEGGRRPSIRHHPSASFSPPGICDTASEPAGEDMQFYAAHSRPNSRPTRNKEKESQAGDPRHADQRHQRPFLPSRTRQLHASDVDRGSSPIHRRRICFCSRKRRQ